MLITQPFGNLTADIIGLPVSHMWRGYGSAIFLEFGALTPRLGRDDADGHPEGEFSLGIEWSWRIENHTSIVCGSWSDEILWEPAFEQLRQSKVTGCELFGHIPEIAISTDSEVRLLSFSTTNGQPEWHLIDQRHSPPRWHSVRNGRLELSDGTEPSH